MKPCKIGTRSSPLALIQVDEVIGLVRTKHPEFISEKVLFTTCGDRDKQTPISSIEGSDFFTREIDRALLDGLIDCAVHSAKDLPDTLPDGLAVAAITPCVDPHDALVSKTNLQIHELPRNARIGTSSNRRKTQLKEYRDDFVLVDIRGNIGERLDLLDHTCLDAVIIAACALIRLSLEHRITQRLPLRWFTTHSMQGKLAVVVRSDDRSLRDFFAVIDEGTS